MNKKLKIFIQILIIFLLAGVLSYYIYSDYFSDKKINNNLDFNNQTIEQIATLDFTKKNKDISQDQMDKYEERFRNAANKFLQSPNDIINFWQLIEIAQIKQLIGDYQGAEQVLLYAEELQPLSYLVHGNLGHLYFRYNQDFAKAEEYYLKAIEEGDPKTIPYYLELHEIYKYFYKQDTNLAEEILKQGIEMHPEANELKSELDDYLKNK